ncbi:methionyl-tRNA formyltransferase [uncultured Ramlibacter sp.]|uniref:methionyl-tRNA formyltransferase n=1 Tax=uncultured Ramlibacter sp. TaxID=260755 RepID=UPI00260C681F|nr:methionyl-tRNA formyltransferase [uncultured Ramlibacter sp.]
MRVIFAGTPEFAGTALQHLHAAGFDIPLVLSQPDRPAGRGMQLQASPVKQFALAHGIAVAQPRSLRLDGKYPQDAAAAQAAIEAARADVMVVAAYGLILPQWTLRAPRLGCLNIHASLLPRWRGAAPIHRAIEAGDSQTGITIMQMDAGLDTGDMLLVERMAIAAKDTTATLHDRLAVLGGRLVVEALELAACGGFHPVPQPAEGVNYAHKIEKAEAAVDWSLPAALIERRIRAFDPFPGATGRLGADVLKLWRSEIDSISGPADGSCGQILSVDGAGVRVACGDGVLRLTELQRAGGKRLPVADFLRGFTLAPGMAFDAPAAA